MPAASSFHAFWNSEALIPEVRANTLSRSPATSTSLEMLAKIAWIAPRARSGCTPREDSAPDKPITSAAEYPAMLAAAEISSDILRICDSVATEFTPTS